jgi:Zn-dependent metalloprotease
MAGSTIRERDAAVDSLDRSHDLRLTQVRRDRLVAWTLHERWGRFYRGVRVLDGEVTRQIRGAVTESIFGALHLAVAIDTTPTIDALHAEALALTAAGEPSRLSSELVILPLNAGSHALAWHVTARSREHTRHLFVHAHSGARLSAFSGDGIEINGGLTLNATIVNCAWMLAMADLVSNDGNGPDLVEKTFYRASGYLMPSGGSLATFRAATIQSARDLYGGSSPVERAVARAWERIGVR